MICRTKRRRSPSSSLWRALSVKSFFFKVEQLFDHACPRPPRGRRASYGSRHRRRALSPGGRTARPASSISCARACVYPSRYRAGAGLPDRLLRDIAANLVATYERNMLAELGDEEIDEPAPVFVLLAGHLGEHLRARRIVLRETVREIRVDAAVLLLVADGEGQNFALGKVLKITSIATSFEGLRLCFKVRRLWADGLKRRAAVLGALRCLRKPPSLQSRISTASSGLMMIRVSSLPSCRAKIPSANRQR